jgi:putative ABC transport system permease protein
LTIDALLDLRAHRVRSALAALGLFIAILSLVAVTTIGTVVRDVFIARDEQLNGRLWTMVGTMDYGLLTAGRLDDVTEELDERVSATGGRYALQAERLGRAASIVGEDLGTADSVRIVLSAGELDGVRRLPVLGGTWLPGAGAVFPDGVVLNEDASALYGGVGTRLRLWLNENLLPYDRPVIGVVADGRGEPRVYQSLRSALHFYPSVASDSGGLALELLVHYPGASRTEMRGKIREVAEAVRVPADSVEAHASSGLADFLSSLEQAQRWFAVVSAVTLLVAVVGLLNIGLATLRERTRELSLRRALGATRQRVFGLVLTTTVVLSGLVAAAAIGLAYVGVVWWVPQFVSAASAIEPPGFPWQAAAYGGLAALAAGLAGGLVPALAAARVDMIQVLRE